MSSHRVTFVDEPLVDLSRGISRHAKEGRRLSGCRQSRARGQAPVKNGCLQFAVQGPRGLARALGSQVKLDLEQGIDRAFTRRRRVAQLFSLQVALQQRPPWSHDLNRPT